MFLTFTRCLEQVQLDMNKAHPARRGTDELNCLGLAGEEKRLPWQHQDRRSQVNLQSSWSVSGMQFRLAWKTYDTKIVKYKKKIYVLDFVFSLHVFDHSSDI